MSHSEPTIHFSRGTERGMYVLHAEQWLPCPQAKLFEFFSDAFNLERLTPPLLHIHVLTPVPIVIEAGTRIDYQLRLHGIPIRWQSEISVWEPPYRFVDRQTRGPYRHWHHEHRFLDSEGGTLAVDHVNYRAPGGSLVNRLFVVPDLRKIFGFRTTKLRALFGDGAKDSGGMTDGL